MVGTFIYNGKIDDKALRDIYMKFNGNVGEIQKSVIGSYCLAIKKYNKVYIFVDLNHTYDMYYYIQRNDFIITNTYYHISTITSQLNFNVNAFIERGFQYSNLGNETVFKEINKILGNEYLIYDLDKNEMNLNETKVVIECDNLNITDLIEARLKDLYTFRDSTGIFMTGGLDSRLVLSILTKIGISPSLIYGEGNSLNTSTKVEDKEIIQILSDSLNLPVTFLNWNDSDKMDREKYYEKYGELALIYNFNKNIIDSFESDIDVKFVEFGYFGEIFRNVDWLENFDGKSLDLAVFMQEFYIKDALKKTLTNYNRYYEFLEYKWRRICSSLKIDPNQISKDDFQKLHLEYRKSADTVMLNFANNFVYSTPILADCFITKFALSQIYEEKISAKLQIKFIENINKDLLDYPFFSHQTMKSYDKNQCALIDTQKRLVKSKEIQE